MKGMKGMQGMLISLSVLLLAVALLYLLSASAQSKSYTRVTYSALSDIDDLNTRFDAASTGFKTILASEGVAVSDPSSIFSSSPSSGSGTTLNLSFKQNTSSLSNYSRDVTRYAQFIQSAQSMQDLDSDVNVSVNLTGLVWPTFYVEPLNITVDSFPGRLEFAPQNTSASRGSVLGYAVLIKLNDTVPTLNWTKQTALPPTDPNALYFHLGIQGTDGTVSYSGYLDKTNPSSLSVLDSTNRSIFTLQTGSPAYLKVYYATDSQLDAIIWLNQSTGLTVALGQDALSIDSEDGTKKIGKVIVFES